MDLRRQLAFNIQRLRRERGWSQEDLALESGIHRTYISGIERCVRNPTLNILERLATTLGVPGAVLFAERDWDR